MDVEGFLQSITQAPDYAGQIVHVHTQPARAAQWAALPDGLHPHVQGFLAALGVSQLYCHQAEAIEAALDGEDVLITTGPASGKSLCYQVPILDKLLTDPEATVLQVFPAKALARDQVASWNRGVNALGDAIDPTRYAAVPFDADANRADRRSARDTARVVVTNPEMLHVNLLPGHGRWARLFQGLRFVIIDEIHSYTGFFGANMANVLRRLERVCEHYGSRPQFICSSATVGNPREMAELVVGRPLHHVADDASAAGSRTFVMWNPPRIKSRKWRGRRSANVEAHELMVRLITQHIPTICFGKARTTAELMYRYCRESLLQQAPELADRVVPYRGGYSPAERREMERRLREGELLGVCATRALELGIDVGALEACIVIGYPGVLNALFQQWGRAGRAGRDCLCILVGTDTLINQYVMNHPEFIFERPIERGVVDLDNPFVVLGHVRCATAELPVPVADVPRFGYSAPLALDVLEEKQKVCRIDDAWYHAAPEPPTPEVRLRGYGDESTVIMDADSGTVLDRLDKFRAVRLFYPGAIYFHRGDTYTLTHHDFERNVVHVRRADVGYYTDPISGTSVDHIDAPLDSRPIGTGTATLGEVFAVLSTFCYERVRFYSLDRIDQQPADVPNFSYEAMSFWITTPEKLPRDVLRVGLDPEDGMRGILYCVSRILPLFLTSDANDFDWSLGCRNAPWHTMFWFEFYLQGIGHSEQCYERLEEILGLTLEQLLTCDCNDGCPNCTSRLITPYHVRNVELGEGTMHSRRAAIVVLHSLLTGQTAEASLRLADAPRAKRGMQFLPAVTGQQRQIQPHRMPLDDRTRRLMLRKLERARSPKEAIDHDITLHPAVGIPPVEAEESVAVTDAEMRAGHGAIRHAGDPLARGLRRKLRSRGHEPSQPEEPPPPAPAEPREEGTIQAGDSLARLARKRRRKKRNDA